MDGSPKPKPRRERVLIIMDEEHAKRVAEAVGEYLELSDKRLSAPTESRIATAMLVALKMIVNRPKGWYDVTFRMAFMTKVNEVLERRLTHEELLVVMDKVYAVIPPREDTDELQERRASRPEEKKSKK